MRTKNIATKNFALYATIKLQCFETIKRPGKYKAKFFRLMPRNVARQGGNHRNFNEETSA